MLDDIDYVYPFNNAYFLSATKGCGNKCGFCTVQTLEPTFVPYIDIKDRIKAIDREFGLKKDLILIDNNVLRSPRFNDIIDDIIAAGFGNVVFKDARFNGALNAINSLTNTEKKILERVLNVISGLAVNNSSQIIDAILNDFSRS